MIRAIYRLKVGGLEEVAFKRAWREAMAAIQENAEGCLGGQLTRSLRDPEEFVIITRWKSIDAWHDFWSKGPPEPQGDRARNEFLIEVDES